MRKEEGRGRSGGGGGLAMRGGEEGAEDEAVEVERHESKEEARGASRCAIEWV